MINIMVVSENRILLKEINTYLCNEDKYEISFVNFSANSLEEFIKIKPEIVILDRDTITPYKTIIKQIKDSNWQYNMIIIHNNDYVDITIDENKKWLNKKYLSKEKVINTLEVIYKNLNTTYEYEDNYVFLSEEKFHLKSNLNYYTLFLAKYNGKNKIFFTQEKFDKLKYVILAYGSIDIICKENKDILLSISKSQISRKIELKSIVKALQEFCFEEYTFFFAENVIWNDLQNVCSKIIKLSEYAYFYNEQIISIEEVYKQVCNMEVKELSSDFINLLDSIFYNRKKEIINKTKNMYMRTIKNKLDFNAIYYIRGSINILDILIKSKSEDDLDELNFNFTNIEDEFENSKNKFLEYANVIEERKMMKIVKKAVIFIFQNATKDISLETTAYEMNISKVYLSRVFKKEVGITFMELLKIIRIYNAKHLLTYTDLKVYEISNEVGYFDSNYFNRQFKKVTSFTPEEYRKTKRKESCIESFI
ncbi:MAG: AraC family transcriptional regulator [Terrisporobacter sp.]|uniref:helix-turn-helix domain-containing protein n=1 Tax=Terrisporobacter sp. TaxID=1965305 RepID=UPI002FCBB798